MDNQQGPTGQHRELCSALCGSVDGRGVWGEMDTCACMAEPLGFPPETITTVLTSYTPIQNKVNKVSVRPIPFFLYGLHPHPDHHLWRMARLVFPHQLLSSAQFVLCPKPCIRSSHRLAEILSLASDCPTAPGTSPNALIHSSGSAQHTLCP